tara:strand:- start:7489 stop:7770 length:282 start_codon:yes stop_codon:yes gene_type:complete
METPLVSVMKLNVTGSFVQSEVTINFDVYHTSNQNLKVVKDEVVSKLLAGRDAFGTDGLKRMQIQDGAYDSWEEGNKKIHRFTFAVKFFYTEQ